MASWLVRSSMDRAIRVRALAGDTVLCSWPRHITLTVPLSTQEYKWVPVICWGNLTNCWGVTCDGLASRPGGVAILLAASCYGNRDKLRPDVPVGSIRLSHTARPRLSFESPVALFSTTVQNALFCGLILHVSTTGNFTSSIKGKSSISGLNRCYRLWPLITALLCTPDNLLQYTLH